MLEKSIKRYNITIFTTILILFILVSFSQVIKASTVQNEAPYANSNFVEINGIVLHYRIDKAVNDQSAGKILMVHGMGGSTYCWRENIKSLNQNGFHVIRVDLPAFGFSDRQPGLNHTAENRADWLWSLLDYLDTEQFSEKENWVLIGHSMGGKTIAEMELIRN
ncbi:MAG: alpha/beta fold hydrolase, partial [Bacillota bacterium]